MRLLTAGLLVRVRPGEFFISWFWDERYSRIRKLLEILLEFAILNLKKALNALNSMPFLY
jgi:hypothetical protein